MERVERALQRAKEQRLSSPLPSLSVATPPQPATDAAWARLPLLNLDPKLIARNRIVTLARSDPAHVPFDMLRTNLLQKMNANGWMTVAITSATPGCGKTVVALNLAFSISRQKDCRCVLMDLDLRRPQVARLLGLKSLPPLEVFLKGQSDLAEHFVRYGDNVAIAANARPVRYSSELLQSYSTAAVLKDLRRRLNPNVVIFDLPPMLSSDDLMGFLPNTDCAVLVVAAEQTTLREADICEHELSQRTNVVGVVLNKCRYTPDKYGY
jgi:protein-tyrosine kinase